MGVVSSRFSRRLFDVCRWRLLCFSIAALDLCVFRISSTFDFKLFSSCTGHTLQALLCDYMCSPHCNKALHVLKFTKYFTNGQCSFYWYFILNSTTNYKITGKRLHASKQQLTKYSLHCTTSTSGCHTAQVHNSDVYGLRRFSPVYLELSAQ